MASNIIAALRPMAHLRGNTLLIATELAHRMNASGYGRVSYQFLAWKAHCCRRTAITQIGRLSHPGADSQDGDAHEGGLYVESLSLHRPPRPYRVSASIHAWCKGCSNSSRSRKGERALAPGRIGTTPQRPTLLDRYVLADVPRPAWSGSRPWKRLRTWGSDEQKSLQALVYESITRTLTSAHALEEYI
jgi:hypothetical protein